MEQWFNFENIELSESGTIRINGVPIWKAQKSFFDISEIKGIDTIEEAILFVKANIDKIEGIIVWIEASRIEIGKFLISSGTKSHAEDKNADVLRYEGVDIEDLDFREEDIHISDDAFIDSLDICDIYIDYEKSPDLNELHLEITFDPDYFGGHRTYIGVDKYMELTMIDL